MAIQLKGILSDFGTAVGNDLVIDVTSLGLAADDFVIIGICAAEYGSDLSVPSVTGDASGAFSNDADLYGDDTRDINAWSYSKRLSGDDTSLTVAAAPLNAKLLYTVRAYTGAVALDVAVATFTGINSDLPNPAPITPTTAGAMIVVFYFAAQAADIAWDAPGDLVNFEQDSGAGVVIARIGSGDASWTGGAFDPAILTGGDSVNRATLSRAAVTYAIRPPIIAEASLAGVGSVSFAGWVSRRAAAVLTAATTFAALGQKVSRAALSFFSRGQFTASGVDTFNKHDRPAVVLAATSSAPAAATFTKAGAPAGIAVEADAMSRGIFDPAIFDPAIFDTVSTGSFPTVTADAKPPVVDPT